MNKDCRQKFPNLASFIPTSSITGVYHFYAQRKLISKVYYPDDNKNILLETSKTVAGAQKVLTPVTCPKIAKI